MESASNDEQLQKSSRNAILSDTKRQFGGGAVWQNRLLHYEPDFLLAIKNNKRQTKI